MLLFASVLIFVTYLGTSWVWSHDWWGASEGTAKIAISSLAGAYVWVTYDLIFRVRQNDVVTSDINRATLRLLLSPPFGFAMSAFAGEVPGMTGTRATSALAFFVGSFPTDTVLKFMRRTAFLWLKLDANVEDDSLKQLMKIDGITTPVAERPIDEGIRTNLQLAYADPISLTIKTGMDFAFILSCCGHAMVRTYFNDDHMKVVDKCGLLTGLEMITLNKALLSYDEIRNEAAKAGVAPKDPDVEQKQAPQLLQNFATALLLDPASARFIVDQIATDPYVAFTWWMWPDTETAERKKPEIDTPGELAHEANAAALKGAAA